MFVEEAQNQIGVGNSQPFMSLLQRVGTEAKSKGMALTS